MPIQLGPPSKKKTKTGGTQGAGLDTGWASFPKLSFGTPATVADPSSIDMSMWTPIESLVRGSIQSPAQIAKLANQQALARERATLAAQEAASNKIISRYDDQATRAQGFARALANLQAGEDEQAFARYNTAANTLTGLGTGLTGAVSDAYQGAVDRTRDMIGQMSGGGEITAPDAGAIRNASQYAGVTIPSTSLEASAVNAARMAQSDAARRTQNLAIIGQGYQSQADQAIAQAAEDARATIGQRPATIAELVNSLTTNRNTGIQQLATLLGNKLTYQQSERKRLDDLAQAEQKRLDDLAQAKITNRQNAQQIAISRLGVMGTLRNQEVAITGVDPVTGKESLAARQWRMQWQRQGKTLRDQMALNLTSQLGYVVDPNTGQAKIKDGHVIPTEGNKVDPKNPLGVVPIFRPSSASTKPREVDLKLSDRLHYLVDSSGRPFFNAKGDPIKTPNPTAKPPKPMSLADRQQMMSTIADTAKGLAEGVTDAKGVHTDAEDAGNAWAFMVQHGFAQNPEMAKLAINALRTAYGKANPDWSATKLDATLFPTAENLAKLKKEEAKAAAAETKAKKAPGTYGDPRYDVGKKWNAKLDPIKSYTTWGDIKTKSGHYVRGNVKDGFFYVE